ncbi:hypothetical protein M569_14795, partial [Genlisea aurea]
ENYDEWAKAMRAGLRAKKKYGFVDGTITERPPEISVDLWEQVNSMLVAWIINTVEPGLRTTVTITDLVFPLWNDLQERFCVSHGPRLTQLKIDLARCQQGGDSVVQYFGRMKKYWDEYTTLDGLPSCNCGGCRCNLNLQLNRKRESDKIHQFLMGL